MPISSRRGRSRRALIAPTEDRSLHVSSADTVASILGSRLDGVPAALMFDIDGTLAPIAPTPTAAGVPADTLDLVRRLAVGERTSVALISGRSVADAARMVAIPGAWIIGNHGFEWKAPDGEIELADDTRLFADAIETAARQLEQRLGDVRGILIENKRWTLAVHHRLVAPDQTDRVLAQARDVAEQLELRTTPGKRILELRPPLDIHKGTAALEFVRRARADRSGSAILYAGDDTTDEDAFRALRLEFPSAATIRIADVESAGEPTSAEFALADPAALQIFLRWLVARRSRGPAHRG